MAASADGFWGTIPTPLKGTTGVGGWGCDSKRLANWFSPRGRKYREPSCVPDFSLGLSNGGAFEPTRVKYIPTIMDRLNKAKRTWKIYGAVKGEAGYGEFDICPTFAQCLYTTQDKHNWVGQLVSEVENSRYWKSSAIFITFDDFGGFYDQVYPGTNTNPRPGRRPKLTARGAVAG